MNVFNTLYTILGSILIYFTSNAWIGTQEDHEQVLTNSTLEYFFSRFLFNLLFILILLIVSFGLNLMIAKLSKSDVQMKRVLTKEGVTFLAFSLIFIGASIFL